MSHTCMSHTEAVMMEGWTLIKGMGLGLAIAAPVGPIGLLCIRRSLTQGQLIGLVTGLGAATADGLYGCIAGFGLTAVADLLVSHTQAMQLMGGYFSVIWGFQRCGPTRLPKPPQFLAEGSGGPTHLPYC